MTTPEFTIRVITPKEHAASLRKELDGGLFNAVTARCDNIYEECSGMNYCSKGYVSEQLVEILDLVRMSEESEKDDGR
jgi:hypothetical protein